MRRPGAAPRLRVAADDTEILRHRDIAELTAAERAHLAELIAASLRAPDAATTYATHGATTFAAEVLAGPGSAEQLSRAPADVVLNGIVGFAGLAATVGALQAGNRVALANKESLVAGGAWVMDLAAGNRIIPVDSEHSAIWQCLVGEPMAAIQALIIEAVSVEAVGAGERLPALLGSRPGARVADDRDAAVAQRDARQLGDRRGRLPEADVDAVARQRIDGCPRGLAPERVEGDVEAAAGGFGEALAQRGCIRSVTKLHGRVRPELARPLQPLGVASGGHHACRAHYLRQLHRDGLIFNSVFTAFTPSTLRATWITFALSARDFTVPLR